MTTPRLQLPTLFDGDWDSALIVTYGAGLEFYERDLLRQLARARTRIVLADARQVARKLADPNAREQLRQVNRTYVLGPIRIDRAAHAKLVMLLSEDRGLLAVGSGNLGMDGYASQGECFTTYRWNSEETDQLRDFHAAQSFVDELCAPDLVDNVVQTRVKQAWSSAPWLYGTSNGEPRVRHNLADGFLDQFVASIGERSVDELVVHAPFYDHSCRAMAELIDRTSPSKIQVLLQERVTSVDPDRLSAVLSHAASDVEVRSVQAEEKGTFLHAKFVIARCGGAAVCLQGSPNISTPAMVHTYPSGNIELANILEGGRGDFDHLVNDLVLSAGHVEISTLGLGLVSDEQQDDDDVTPPIGPTELSWVSPNLTGIFVGEVRIAPRILVNGAVVDDVVWSLSEPDGDTTRFKARLGDESAASLDRVAAVTFEFGDGVPTNPTFPYHLRTLMALASGHGRTDLLKQAGDFDLDDEELEELLAQLDEVLVVDGRSIWRMLKRSEPAEDDESISTIVYEDLDWDAIQAHPKLAQYRTWDQQSATDPTALGILLTSITDRFESELDRRRSGTETSGAEALDPMVDLGSVIEPEDEEQAEELEQAKEKRRVSARGRARRQFHSFIDRFVHGLTDEEFVRNMGPSVIVPSYVVFNHLCWKLIQIDLVDPMRIISAQIELWRYFWGRGDDPGYLSQMGEDEQGAALEILERHHSESVLLCALFQAYGHAWHEEDDVALVDIRDAWRTILLHDLWQPTRSSLLNSSTLLEPACESAVDLVEELDSLASLVASGETLTAIASVTNVQPQDVLVTSGRVRRGSLGERDVPIYAIEKAGATLGAAAAATLLSALHQMSPDDDYIRIEDRVNDVVAFSDYQSDVHVYANRATDEDEDMVLPDMDDPPWVSRIEALYAMAEIGDAA